MTEGEGHGLLIPSINGGGLRPGNPVDERGGGLWPGDPTDERGGGLRPGDPAGEREKKGRAFTARTVTKEEEKGRAATVQPVFKKFIIDREGARMGLTRDERGGAQRCPT